MKMDIYNFAYKYVDKKVYFASLHLQGKDETREVIFKFIWKKRLTPSNFWDAENEKDMNITKIDHISFHKDGKVLLSYYNPKKEHYYERSLGCPISKLPDNGCIPLFIFSVNNLSNHFKYIGSPTVHESGNSVADLMWDVKNQPFSIGVFAFKNNCDPFKILNVKFPNIFITYDTAWFPYAINKNIGLLVAFSKRLVMPNGNQFINPKYLKDKKFKFEKYPATGMALIPSDKRINSLNIIEECH